MSIRIHPHCRQRMQERGAAEEEIVAAVEHGGQLPMKFGRRGFRRNFTFEREWRAGKDSPMKLTYDPRYNIAYLRLHEKTGSVETVHVSDELNVDIGSDGTVYGIELLNANAQLRSEDSGKLVLVNEALNERAELPFDVTTAAVGVREKPPGGYGSRE